jgi:hypothetical protein
MVSAPRHAWTAAGTSFPLARATAHRCLRTRGVVGSFSAVFTRPRGARSPGRRPRARNVRTTGLHRPSTRRSRAGFRHVVCGDPTGCATVLLLPSGKSASQAGEILEPSEPTKEIPCSLPRPRHTPPSTAAAATTGRRRGSRPRIALRGGPGWPPNRRHRRATSLATPTSACGPGACGSSPRGRAGAQSSAGSPAAERVSSSDDPDGAFGTSRRIGSGALRRARTRSRSCKRRASSGSTRTSSGLISE